MTIERATPADLAQLAADAASVPNQVGALLRLHAGADTDLERLRRLVGDRLAAVPRLRQRLVRAPLGGGRPFWRDDPSFDPRDHVTLATCPPPGDDTALLGLAAGRMTRPLPRSRPLWSATLVTGLERGTIGLVVVFHHVVADGIGGLAVLARLLDGVETGPAPSPAPRRPPTRRQLVRDAAARRWDALRRLPRTIDRIRQAAREVGALPPRAPRCSLNGPTTGERQVTVVRQNLASLRDIAHRHGATINDVLLTAVTGALAGVLRQRGEGVERLVVTMLIASRSTTTADRLGNQAAVAPVAVPVDGPPAERLRAVAALTRARKAQVQGEASALLGYGLRLLARLGLLRRFVDRQRRVNTFLTNVRGPDRCVAIAGHEVADLVPLSLATGNVTVAFAALSYAGTMTLAIVTDPRHHPDVHVLVDQIAAQFAALTTA